MLQLSRKLYLVTALLVAFTTVGLSGCRKGIIDRVVVQPSESLDRLRVSLFFNSGVQVALDGNIALKDYGNVYAISSAVDRPFEMGFDLETDILLDPEYVQKNSTYLLPNGTPIGLPTPLVEIRGTNEISPYFDLFGYADTRLLSWLGVATMFSVNANTGIPAGISLTQVFMRDDIGNPALIASVYGPGIKPDGVHQFTGGIAVFANARYLLGKVKPAQAKAFKPERRVLVGGPGAYQVKKKQIPSIQYELLHQANLSFQRYRMQK